MSQSSREPIAIVGLGCRFPGASNLAAYWRLMCRGGDAITEVPRERFDIDAYYDPRPGTPGKMSTRYGGFVADIDRFDPYFFGISPREAIRLDPQQRMLLESGWDAIEDAGLLPGDLVNSLTGVFVGICTHDYAGLQHRSIRSLDVYVGTGAARAAAGRLAHVLGLNGPVMVVDTACSSSLVAVHLAIEAMQRGECSQALAAGANAILLPYTAVAWSQGGMLSPEGRCKAFDEGANGFVRSDGSGVVVLKPLSRAVADEDRIYAVIRGSAVNNDGSYSTFMMPAREGQEAVLRQAYAKAGVAGGDVEFVEAHGTGTAVGDPIEIAALSAVLGEGRPKDRRCWLGAGKTNIGHSEAAAGIAGLIKASLCLHHRMIPPNLHCPNPSSAIPWEEVPFVRPERLTPWPKNGKPALAGVNSFGVSGTNAHVVLEEAPDRGAVEPLPGGTPCLLTLSAKSPEALRASAEAYREFLGETVPEAPSLLDVCFTASARRGHHDYRAAVAGESRERMIAQLEEALGDPARWENRTGTKAARPVFIFSGAGSQWLGMGRKLREQEPAFREALERCDEAIGAVAGWSVLEEIEAPPAAGRLDRMDILQPTIFSVQTALAAMWRSWGIEPAAVAGHSVGEFAAAHLSGALSLEDAAAAVTIRSRMMHRMTGQGRMLAVELTWEQAEEAIADCADRVAVGVWNSPISTVLSGDGAALERISERLLSREVFCRWVKVEVASHSPQMEPLVEELREALKGIRPGAESIPVYSSLTGSRISGVELGGDYWVRNMRQPVLFAPLVNELLAAGHNLFLEVSPHPLLQIPMRQSGQHAGKELTVLPTLRREEGGRGVPLESLGALFVRGCGIEWSKVHRGGRVVSLPGYQWQRERFWIEAKEGRVRREPHPLLETHWESAQHPGTHFWETEIDLETLGYLEDHRVQGIPLMPTAAYLEMALAGSMEVFGSGPRVLHGVEILKPLFLASGEIRRLQLVMWPERTGRARFRIFSMQEGAAPAEHVRGELEYEDLELTDAQAPDVTPEGLRAAFPTELTSEQIYEIASRVGLEYGPSLRGCRRMWVNSGEKEAVAEVRLAEWCVPQSSRYRCHPAILDAVTHASFGARMEQMQRGGELRLPVEVRRFEFHRTPDPRSRLWSYVRASSDEPAQQDALVFDDEGRLVLRDVRVSKPIAMEVARDVTAGWLFEPVWDVAPQPPQKDCAPAKWLIVSDGETPAAAKLAAALEAGGHDVVRASLPVAPEVSRNIVYLVEADAGSEAEPLGVQERICGGMLGLVQDMLSRGWPSPPRLWIVTRGAHRVSESDEVSLSMAPLTGLARVMANECPQLRVTRIDLPAEALANEGEALAAELLAGDSEPETALRGSGRHALRLASWDPADPVRPQPRRKAPAGGSFRVETKGAGQLDNLTLRSAERRAPGQGEVEIRVSAVGLNFLDVLRALNMLPVEAMGPAVFGAECSGRIVAVGEGVSRFQVGDEVMVRDAHSGCLCGYLTTRADAVWAKPAKLTMEEAATIPIAYQTAWYALHTVGRLRAGESVLIHSAAGGVGLAAVEVARQAGAEVFATASPEKHEYLRSIGVKHVFHSRTLDFAAEILEATGGRGVDVALNSLAGEAIPKTLSVLATGGRFLEIGKRDIYGNTQLGLLPFQKNLSFHAIDLLRMPFERPDVVESLSRELGERVSKGVFPPLPYKVFPIGKVADAFHYMAQGKHIGKIVVSLEESDLEVEAAAPSIRPDCTYLITGGFSGLGLVCARQLVEAGARSLVLVGRRGMIAEAEPAIAEMRAKGAHIAAVAADVGRREEVARVAAMIRETMPPLRGVIHSAGILCDGILANLDWPQFEAVFPSKAGGAWNLHCELEGTPVDFFILFSSAAATLGSAGQGNYAAANAFLDGLAHYRQSRGLAALAINWGAWSEVGLAAKLVAEGAMRLGFGSIAPAQGAKILDRLLREHSPQVAVLPIDWSVWTAKRSEIRNPLFARFAEAGAAPASGEKRRSLADEMFASGDDAQGLGLLEEFLRTQACAVLRLPAGKLDSRMGLDRLGLDSLMAVELKNRIERELPVTIAVVRLLRGPSVADLAQALYEEVKALADSLAKVGEMSDEEVAALMAASD